ncbi:MAG: hypothetical protein AUJ60_03925 [Nitrospirae bacterium CG1_02_44_142]|nr:MAG: hypothetical protein AUJ60_03925 [Nitrospirae bacterium CG1_02_44_142]
MGVYEEVKQALQDVVAPELRALQVEIKRLDEKIDSGIKRLDEKIDSFRLEVTAESRRLDEKIDIAIQIRERLASLEAKMAVMGR